MLTKDARRVAVLHVMKAITLTMRELAHYAARRLTTAPPAVMLTLVLAAQSNPSPQMRAVSASATLQDLITCLSTIVASVNVKLDSICIKTSAV